MFRLVFVSQLFARPLVWLAPVALALVLAGATALRAQAPTGAGTSAPVDAAAFKQLAAQQGAAAPLVLDVRRPGELTRSGLVRGARHADFTSPDYAAALAALLPPPGRPVLIYCHSGGRAQLAAQALAAQGYTVRWFDGMLSELKAAGVPFDVWTGPSR